MSASLAIDVAYIASTLGLLPGAIVRMLTTILELSYLCYLSPAFFLFIIALAVVFVISVIQISKLNVAINYARTQDDAVFKSYRTMIDEAKELNINHNRRAFFYKNEVEPCMDRVKDKELEWLWLLHRSRPLPVCLLF